MSRTSFTTILMVAGLSALSCASTPAAKVPVKAPHYAPTAWKPTKIDITTNAYGALSSSPKALKIGDKVSAFSLPTHEGKTFEFRAGEGEGPLVIVFFRGFW